MLSLRALPDDPGTGLQTRGCALSPPPNVIVIKVSPAIVAPRASVEYGPRKRRVLCSSYHDHRSLVHLYPASPENAM